ncbi:hypothetical protein [Tardiphaga robiniae]|uniref:Uncharacterized protein n=1 Tax=Tardiphaga robiniae TaxID=943830 RepID=A0A7G6TVN9_9BRAD|nr:hypothetical protein [Tardiphaga robiniae]QND70821.1 hypothetical protein HB776_05910 [Tardiphaga robiniae]
MFWKKNEPPPPPPVVNDEPPGEVEKLLKIKNICWIAEMSAESYGEMSPEQQADEFGQYEYARYRQFQSEAISLAREMRDEFYRDSALHFLINLLMVAKEYELAKKLFNVVEVDIIQDAILKEYPALGAKF